MCCIALRVGTAAGDVFQPERWLAAAQVKLHGFKSYKDQAVLDEFSPDVNVVGARSPLDAARLRKRCKRNNLKRAAVRAQRTAERARTDTLRRTLSCYDALSRDSRSSLRL